jgi:hypothetical protein
MLNPMLMQHVIYNGVIDKIMIVNSELSYFQLLQPQPQQPQPQQVQEPQQHQQPQQRQLQLLQGHLKQLLQEDLLVIMDMLVPVF